MIAADEMARVFNCGIGMAVIAAAGEAERVGSVLEEQGETVYHIGRLEAADDTAPRVEIRNLELFAAQA